ncbi:hypothetical protein ACXX82_00900, partial [Glaciimonas sp. GNP009]
MPTLEFLVEAAFESKSTVVVRSVLGDEQKNYEHASRGCNKPTSETIANIQSKLAQLSWLFPASQPLDLSVPLAPALLAWVGNIEAQFVQFLRQSTLHGKTCPHCDSLVVADPAEWWEATGLGLDAPAYRFIDRLLKGLVAWEKIGNSLLQFFNKKPDPKNAVARLLSAKKGPLWLWFQDYTHAANARNLIALHAQLESKGILGSKDKVISYDLLSHWSSTQHLIPVAAVHRLLGALNDAGSLKKRQFIARQCELVHDLVRSTAVGLKAPSTATVRNVVLRRFEFLVGLEHTLTVDTTTS